MRYRSNAQAKRGFTLVELLIVIAIIAVLSIFGGANYIQSLKKGRDSRRKADLEQIRAALEMYRTDQGEYPIATDYSTAQDELMPATGTKYLNKEMADPNQGEYDYDSDGQEYTLCATLEAETDSNYCVLNP